MAGKKQMERKEQNDKGCNLCNGLQDHIIRLNLFQCSSPPFSNLSLIMPYIPKAAMTSTVISNNVSNPLKSTNITLTILWPPASL